LEKSLILLRKRYAGKLIDGIQIYTPDEESLAVVHDALLVLRRSPNDYKDVCNARFVIFVTRIISRDWNVLKQRCGIRPVWFIDKGILEKINGYDLASLFVHEARHVYQRKNKRLKHFAASRALREKDACEKQMQFLSRFGQRALIKYVQESLADEYWTEASRKRTRSYDYFSLLHAELLSSGILQTP